MLSVEEALRAVLAECRPLPARRCPSRLACAHTLAEDVAADLDSPPFDKALVDGFAVRSADLTGPDGATLRIVDEITAGRHPSRPIDPGECASIMTGAPLPPGADAVVMHELTHRPDASSVAVPGPVAAGVNRLARGAEMRAGEIVLRRGDWLNPARCGVLASVGRAEVLVHQQPSTLVIPTGDELVEPAEVPGPGQIRNSNGQLIESLVRASRFEADSGPIARDDPEELRRRFALAVGDDPTHRRDVLIACGGVSAGKLDLVPSALEAAGVRPVFHKVRLRPGKPLWFGVGPDRAERPPALVFGLPGNPVSGIVGTLLFVLPALAALAGRPSRGPTRGRYPLAADYRHRGERATYHPARLIDVSGGFGVEPLPWAGSPDLLTVARADGFAAFPPGDCDHRAGEAVDFLPLPGVERP